MRAAISEVLDYAKDYDEFVFGLSGFHPFVQVSYKCQSSLFKLLLLSSFGHEQVRDIGPTAHFQLFGDPLDSSHDKSPPQIHCAFGVA